MQQNIHRSAMITGVGRRCPPPLLSPPVPSDLRYRLTVTQSTSPAASPVALADALVARMAQIGRCAIAFSGGVDSAVVAAAAVRAGTSSLAITAVSASVAQVQRQIAQRVAGELGIDHRWVTTDELSRPGYVQNDVQRCFHCKQTLYAALETIADQYDPMPLVSGTNADDLGDYRPGIQAGRAAGVQTPLADLAIGKAQVRQIATLWNLSVAELPASPCLASRLAYGVEVTDERLRRVEAAEAWLAKHGFSPLRVRLHAGELARIEVAVEQLPRLVQPPLAEQLLVRLRQLGFQAVTIDLAGFRSGSLNQLVSLPPPSGTAARSAAALPVVSPPSVAAERNS